MHTVICANEVSDFFANRGGTAGGSRPLSRGTGFFSLLEKGEVKVEDQKVSEMIPVILKDGSVYEVSSGTTWADVAAGRCRCLGKEAVAA